MPVTADENEKYRVFVHRVAQELGVFNFDPETIIWHYTNEQGLLGILQSSCLFATQVAFLNDRRETKYAQNLFVEVIKQIQGEKADDPAAVTFLDFVQSAVKDDPENPTQGTSKFFVTSFSGDEDSVDQWSKYGKSHGYAIGFTARGFFREPNSALYRVVYDYVKQLNAVKQIAMATLDFFREGLTAERATNPALWAEEFFNAWDEWIYKFAPLAKEPKWSVENEFRLVHELKPSEISKVRFAQKATDTMLTRYLALDTPSWKGTRQPLLPIRCIIVGPNNDKAFNVQSVRMLLQQMGYGMDVAVTATRQELRWV